MRPELCATDLEHLAESIASTTANVADDGAFPAAAFAILRARELTAAPPVGAREMPSLLRLLMAVGRGDLSTGRIFEGHVNSCWLVDRFGSEQQKTMIRSRLHNGGLLGVWNTDAPDDPLRLEAGTLQGKKNFASGVDGLSHAIVTVTEPAGRQMLLVPLAELPVDRSWWRPVGMKASGSHIVDFSGLPLTPAMMLGQADDYIAQPWFSGGAMRFLAVQVGGIRAIFDIALNHLVRTKRADNPYQAHRLARMGAAVETTGLWVDRMGIAWVEAEERPDAAAFAYLKACVNGGRVAIEAAAMAVLEEAEQAIGAAGMIEPHPFERRMRDLRTYLRQPNPDGAAAQFGESIANGSWAPGQRVGGGGHAA